MVRDFFILLACLFFILPVRVHAQEVLSWKDCIREAAKNHPDLISAEQSIKQSQADKEITSSSYFPQINAEAGVSTVKTESSGSKTTKTYTYGTTAKQLLFDAFKTSDNVKAAAENVKAAQFNYKFVSAQIRLRLRTAFISLLKAQELLKITEEIRKIRRGDLGLITLRYESGMEHRGALLTAEANLAQAEFEIAQTKREVEIAQRQLFKEMGRIQFYPVLAKGDFKVADEALEKPDFESLAKKNPSAEKLFSQKNAASFGVKAAKAGFLPQVSAQVGANRSDSHLPVENDQWDAAVTVSVPLFEGGLKQAQLLQARASLKQAEANERSVKDGLIVSLEQTWVALRDAVQTLRVEEKFLIAAEERAKIAESQYSLGLIQYDNWTIIEDDLVRVKKAYLDAQANALVAEANWIQAKGETLEYAE